MGSNNTKNLDIRFLEGQQASKHITVNEAFARIDGLLSKSITLFKINQPPLFSEDGDVYIIGEAPVEEWVGHSFDVCYRINGGWEFFSPPIGWSVWVRSLSSAAIFVGSDWLIGAIAIGNEGQSTNLSILTTTLPLTSGSRIFTNSFIPDKTIVLGVTALVTSDLVGPDSWSLGTSDSYNRYGDGHGMRVGSKITGLTSSPLTYYGDSALVISSNNESEFISGSILISAHTINIGAPILDASI